MRGGHLTMVFMGAFQVAENGDLANWITNDTSALPAVGGAMDLAIGCKDIRVLMEHTTKEGIPRLVHRCSYPLTARAVVKKIYTDLAIVDVTSAGLVVREMVEGLTFDTLRKMTNASLLLDENCKLLMAKEL
jgi:3-oxoadipate CoA-transferase beta subunit